MFEQLQLPAELSKLMVSFTPLLGISGNIENHKLFVLTNYFPINNNRLVISFSEREIPKEISLNVLRKGEDSKILAALANQSLDVENLKKCSNFETPLYNLFFVHFFCI